MRQQNVPRAVNDVAVTFLWVGIPVLCPAIALVLLGGLGLLYDTVDVEKIRPDASQGTQFRMLFNAIERFMVSVGLIVMPLGLVPTLAGLGLLRMKRWGLFLGYMSGLVWILELLYLISLSEPSQLLYMIVATFLLLPSISVWKTLSKLHTYF